MSKRKPAPSEPSNGPIALVLFGVLSYRKTPVGAWFRSEDAAVARWIARHEHLTLFAPTTDAARTVAGLLKEWQLKGNGRPDLPSISGSVWENLRSLAAAPSEADGEPAEAEGPSADDDATAAARARDADALWNSLVVHSVVLARYLDSDGDDCGWWEAVILAIHDGVYTLAWTDEPESGLFRRRLHELALTHPGA